MPIFWISEWKVSSEIVTCKDNDSALFTFYQLHSTKNTAVVQKEIFYSPLALASLQWLNNYYAMFRFIFVCLFWIS